MTAGRIGKGKFTFFLNTYFIENYIQEIIEII